MEMPSCPAQLQGSGRVWALPRHGRRGGWRSRFTSSDILFQAISLQWIPTLVMQRGRHVTAPGILSIKRKPRWSQGRAGWLPAAPGSVGGGSQYRDPRVRGGGNAAQLPLALRCCRPVGAVAVPGRVCWRGHGLSPGGFLRATTGAPAHGGQRRGHGASKPTEQPACPQPCWRSRPSCQAALTVTNAPNEAPN